MLVLKFTCDAAHHLNTKIISEKFSEALGVSKDIVLKEEQDKDTVKLYLGKKGAKNISLSIEITDEDVI